MAAICSIGTPRRGGEAGQRVAPADGVAAHAAAGRRRTRRGGAARPRSPARRAAAGGRRRHAGGRHRGGGLGRGRDLDGRAEDDVGVLGQAVVGRERARGEVVRRGDGPQRLAGARRCAARRPGRSWDGGGGAEPRPAGRSCAAQRAPPGVGHCSTPRVARILLAHRVMRGLTGPASGRAACMLRLDGRRPTSKLWTAEVALVRAQLAARTTARACTASWPGAAPSPAGRSHGNALEMLREGRLELGEHVLFEPGVWLTAPAPGRIRDRRRLLPQPRRDGRRDRAGRDRRRTACSPTAASSPTPTTASTTRRGPCPWQGFTTKGPTRIGDNVWCGANVVVTSGVTIGERCVIGANSVVTRDLPAVLDRRRRAGARHPRRSRYGAPAPAALLAG